MPVSVVSTTQDPLLEPIFPFFLTQPLGVYTRSEAAEYLMESRA